jgi:hypothetical protein
MYLKAKSNQLDDELAEETSLRWTASKLRRMDWRSLRAFGEYSDKYFPS